MKEIKNALIKSTFLGVEDHGIFTCYLYLDYGGEGQGFGGYALDIYNEKIKARRGTAYGMEFIRRVIEAVGVSSWEELPGKTIKVEADYGRVYRICGIISKEWFEQDKLLISEPL